MLKPRRPPAHDDIAIAVAVPYRVHVTPTVVSLEDGAFVLAWKLGGQAFECLTDDEVVAAHERLNVFLRNLAAPEVSLWTHVLRDYAPTPQPEEQTSGFAARVAHRYQSGLATTRLMHNELYVSLVYKPSGLSRISSGLAPSGKDGELAAAIAMVGNLGRTLEASLAPYDPVALTAYPHEQHTRSQLLEFFARLVNAESQPVPLAHGPVASLLGTARLLFGWETVEYRTPTTTRLGAFLGLKEYPNPTRAGMLDGLLAAPFPLVLTQSFTFLSRGAALGLLDRQAHRLGNAGDAAVSQVVALRGALDALASGEFVMGDHHFSLQVLTPPFSRDGSEHVRIAALNESVARARSLLADVGCLTAREDFAVAPAFWAQLPGNHAQRPRLAPITSRNFAALAPFHDYPVGRAEGNHWGAALAQLRTRAQTLYHFSLHATDPRDPSGGSRSDTGHTFVCGPTGSGKTVFMGFLVCLLEQRGTTQILFDKDCGLEVLVRALDGLYLPLKRGNSTGCNPLQIGDGEGERAFLRRWLLMLIDRPGRPLAVSEEAELDDALAGLLALERSSRRLSRLLEFLDPTRADGPHARLRPWCESVGGPLGWVFDAPVDAITRQLAQSRLVGFDMTEILQDPLVRAPLTAYLFQRIETLLDGRPLVAWIDEFSKLIGTEEFAELAADGTKTWRKRNAVMAFATQTPGDILASPVARALVEQTPTKILFPNPDAALADYVEGMGLTDREWALLRQELTPGSRQFLIRQGHHSVVAELDLRALADELRVISGRTSTVEAVRALIDRYGTRADAWLPHFIPSLQKESHT
jgi:type IV secretion system protein VirB4